MTKSARLALIVCAALLSACASRTPPPAKVVRAPVFAPTQSFSPVADDVLFYPDVFVTCGPVLNGYIGTDSATGRAVALKLRITDPDPIWNDFWQTWSHTEAARLKSVYDGVTSATGAAPEL